METGAEVAVDIYGKCTEYAGLEVGKGGACGELPVAGGRGGVRGGGLRAGDSGLKGRLAMNARRTTKVGDVSWGTEGNRELHGEGPGAGGFVGGTGGEEERIGVAGGHNLEADGEAVGGEAGGD